MKMLKKLALVSAVSMISAGAFAMEAMDDETMATTTGQDGITILVAPGTRTAADLTALGVSSGVGSAQAAIDLTTNGTPGADGVFKALSIRQVVVHDADGWTAAQGGTADTANSGAIVIGNGTAIDSTVIFADNATPISIEIDAVGDHNGATAGGSPMLNIKISTPTLGIKMGAVYVADSFHATNAATAANITTTQTNGVGGAYAANTQDNDGTVDGNQYRGLSGEILGDMEIILGATTINIQLGAETQGSMIAVNASILGGLTINNMALNDTAGGIMGGSIGASSLTIKDVGGANLTANVRVDVGNATVSPTSPLGEGLYVTLAQLGDATNGADVTLNNQYLGSNTANDLGDVQIKGLNLSGTTLVIRGH